MLHNFFSAIVLHDYLKNVIQKYFFYLLIQKKFNIEFAINFLLLLQLEHYYNFSQCKKHYDILYDRKMSS